MLLECFFPKYDIYMKNLFKLIINFFKRLFGIKDKPIEETKPEIPTDTGTTEDETDTTVIDSSDTGDDETLVVSGDTSDNDETTVDSGTTSTLVDSSTTEEEQEEIDCSKLRIDPSDKIGKGGKIKFNKKIV